MLFVPIAKGGHCWERNKRKQERTTG